MSIAEKRVTKEVKGLEEKPPTEFKVVKTKNTRHVLLCLNGAVDTPYEGGKFYVEFFFPDDYPSNAPKSRFLTKIFHPNIDKIGRICLDIFKEHWSAALQLRTIGISLMALLSNPNVNDPLDQNVAKEFIDNPEEAKLKAIEWTKKYAIDEQNLFIDCL